VAANAITGYSSTNFTNQFRHARGIGNQRYTSYNRPAYGRRLQFAAFLPSQLQRPLTLLSLQIDRHGILLNN
jgi:hypothetical protein